MIDENKLIDADELIGRLEEYIESNNAYIRRFSGKSPYQKDSYIENGAFQGIIDLVNKMSKLSLESKTSDKWIPCSERLPKEHLYENGADYVSDEVFCTCKHPVYGRRVFESFTLNGDWAIEDGTMEKVTAWMPSRMPEPYKGE